jgi:methylmalonyl-CoA mutase N-terminal domain/subunit
MDEALALPSEKAVTIALRTQQVIAAESGVANTVDPLGGSYFIESLTNRLEAQALDYFQRIEDLGGVLPAIAKGFFQREIADSAYTYQCEIDDHTRTIVGVNDFVDKKPIPIPLLEFDPVGFSRQVDRLKKLRRERDSGRVGQALDHLRLACQGTENTMPHLLEAVRAYATLGEIIDVMRAVFGTYTEPTWI